MTLIAETIKKLAASGDEVYTIPCKVTAIDETERTCDVQPLNGDAEIFGVRLQANLSDEKGVCVFPKSGSEVLVTFINKKTGYVALCSEVDKVVGKFGTFEYTQDDQGFEASIGGQSFSITNQSVKIDGFLESVGAGSGLKTVLFDLIDKLSSATITTPLGPSTGVFDPTIIASFQLLKIEFAKFLK